MRIYHHLGIPTNESKPGEVYLERYRAHVSGFETSPYGVEWMRFEPDCPLPELIRRVPHIAFRVDRLEPELEGKEVLVGPNSPSEGVRVAFIVDNGAPIEFIEFLEPTSGGRPDM